MCGDNGGCFVPNSGSVWLEQFYEQEHHHTNQGC